MLSSLRQVILHGVRSKSRKAQQATTETKGAMIKALTEVTDPSEIHQAMQASGQADHN